MNIPAAPESDAALVADAREWMKEYPHDSPLVMLWLVERLEKYMGGK